MRSKVLLVILNLILVILQTSFNLELFGSLYNPNLVLALALALFTLAETETALFVSVVGGLLLDLVGVSVIGISPVVFSGLLLFVVYLRQYLFRGSLFFLLVIVLCPFLASFLVGFVNGNIVNVWELLVGSLVTSVTTLIFLFICRRVLRAETAF